MSNPIPEPTDRPTADEIRQALRVLDKAGLLAPNRAEQLLLDELDPSPWILVPLPTDPEEADIWTMQRLQDMAEEAATVDPMKVHQLSSEIMGRLLVALYKQMSVGEDTSNSPPDFPLNLEGVLEGESRRVMLTYRVERPDGTTDDMDPESTAAVLTALSEVLGMVDLGPGKALLMERTVKDPKSAEGQVTKEQLVIRVLQLPDGDDDSEPDAEPDNGEPAADETGD